MDGVDDSERDPISFSMVLDGKIAVSSVVWLSMIFENSRTHVGQTSLECFFMRGRIGRG